MRTDERVENDNTANSDAQSDSAVKKMRDDVGVTKCGPFPDSQAIAKGGCSASRHLGNLTIDGLSEKPQAANPRDAEGHSQRENQGADNGKLGSKLGESGADYKQKAADKFANEKFDSHEQDHEEEPEEETEDEPQAGKGGEENEETEDPEVNDEPNEDDPESLDGKKSEDERDEQGDDPEAQDDDAAEIRHAKGESSQGKKDAEASTMKVAHQDDGMKSEFMMHKKEEEGTKRDELINAPKPDADDVNQETAAKNAGKDGAGDCLKIDPGDLQLIPYPEAKLKAIQERSMNDVQALLKGQSADLQNEFRALPLDKNGIGYGQQHISFLREKGLDEAARAMSTYVAATGRLVYGQSMFQPQHTPETSKPRDFYLKPPAPRTKPDVIQYKRT